MRYLAPLLVTYSMVCFTDPQGFAVWVDRNQVVSVTRPHGCGAGTSSKVSTGNGTALCIRETVREAVDRLDGKRR